MHTQHIYITLAGPDKSSRRRQVQRSSFLPAARARPRVRSRHPQFLMRHSTRTTSLLENAAWAHGDARMRQQRRLPMRPRKRPSKLSRPLRMPRRPPRTPSDCKRKPRKPQRRPKKSAKSHKSSLTRRPRRQPRRPSRRPRKPQKRPSSKKRR